MKNFVLAFFNFVFITVILVSSISSTYAVGNTSSDTNPGQVKTGGSNGALYLTTQVNSQPQATNPNTPTRLTTTVNSPLTTSRTTGETLFRPTGFADNLGSYLNSILNITMIISLLLVFYHFIAAGFQWITSGGDKGKTEEARSKIVNAFVGILIVSSSFALATFVAYILGFQSINEALSNVKQINPS